mgnify:CR=1 FL=1
MKNKLFNKFLSVLLVSFIGLTSISSFNHVSAAEFDSSYTNQLVNSKTSLHKDLWGYPQLPPPNDPKLKPFWMGAVAYLVAMFSVKVNSPSNHTFNVLQNGLSDNSTSIFINNTLNNSPNFNMNDFANDPDVINGNFDSVYNKYSSKVNVDKNGFINLENHNKNLYYDGGNKNYYTNNDYSSVNNYQVYNNTTNHINYTYNNQHYNYTTNNYYYNYTNNTYIYNIANNQNISISNTYNNTTIISPSGATQKLYYELPDGSNSLNLTEEQAKKGFKTSLNVASYSNGYDDDNLNFLFHFDGNEYDSAYPIVNYNLKAIPNSVDYIDSSNPSFNQALAFSDSFDLSVEGSNYNNYYSFRIYPHISDNWSFKINGIDIASVTSKYDTTSTYEEYKSFIEVPSSCLYVYYFDNYYIYVSPVGNYLLYFVTDKIVPFNKLSLYFNKAIRYSESSSSDYYTTDNNVKLHPVTTYGNKLVEERDEGRLSFNEYDVPNPSKDTALIPCFIYEDSSGSIVLDPNITIKSLFDSGAFGSKSYKKYYGTYKPYFNNYTLISNSLDLYENLTAINSTNFRQYNFINDKTFLQTGTNLLNYNQWNFISIDTSGKVFINGVDTNIIVPLDQLKISVTGDSLTYIDELASFKTNRSNISPSIPYDSNVSYYLPPVYYEDVYTPKQSFKDGVYSLAYPSFTDFSSINLPFTFNNFIHFSLDYNTFRFGSYLIYSSDFSFRFAILDSEFYFYISDLVYRFPKSSTVDFTLTSDYILCNGDKKTFDTSISFNYNFLLYRSQYLSFNSVFNLSTSTNSYSFYNVINSNGVYGFYSPSNDVFLSVGSNLSNIIYYVQNVKKSEIKNNMLLIQSLVPINSSKFGGIRPSNPSTGDVYCSVNENGNITSVQQYNGIEWVKVVGSIYNDALGLWVNAVGFNIFLDNWSYQDIDFRADNPDTNILIRFLTSQFNKVTDLLDSIIEKIKGISSEDTVINNYQNNYNVDINTNIDNLINTSKDYDKDIDLNSPNYNVDDSILTDINNLAVGSKGIFKALDDSGFSILYLAPLILLLVGLLL